MKKIAVVVFVNLFLCLNLNAEVDIVTPLKSQYLKKLIYSTIENEVVWSKDVEGDQGSMWLADVEEATVNVVGKILKDQTSGALTMNTVSTFACGSTHDESDMGGYCEVSLSKLPNKKWEVSTLGKCTCGSY